MPAIDGMQSGEFVDYALHDYGGSADLSSAFPGMPKSNMGLYSQEFGKGSTASESDLRSMREKGYHFEHDFCNGSLSCKLWVDSDTSNGKNGKSLYDDELVFDGIKYPKDWN